MAVTFPPNPNVGDTITDPDTGSTWLWDGVKWTFGPAGGGPGADDNYFELDGSSVTWTASGQTQSLATFTLPAGDWDISGIVGTVMRFANIQGLILTGYINGVPIPNLAPNMQGSTVITQVGSYGVTASTFRVYSPDAPADIDLQLTLSYVNQATNPNAWMYLTGRNWEDAGDFGEYMEFAPPAVTWTTSGAQLSLGVVDVPAGDWDMTGMFIFDTGGGDCTGFAGGFFINGVGTPASLGAAVSAVPFIAAMTQFNTAMATLRVEGPATVGIQMQLGFANVDSATGQVWLRARRWS